MKKYYKALVVAGLCVSMAFGVTACGSAAPDGSQKVATVGDKEITLGEANFLLRYQQVQTESYYESMLGATGAKNIYDLDIYGNGTTFGQNMKESVMNQIQEYVILEQKASDYGVTLTEEETSAIKEAAAAFLEANSEETKEQMTADQETVEKMLSWMTITQKTLSAIYAEADVTVSDEEAVQRGFGYISVSKGSGEEALTEEEIGENKDKLSAVIESVNGGSTLEEAAAAADFTVSTGAYGKDNTGSYSEEVIAALDALKEGEISEVIETETALYVVQLTTERDEEATEARRESLMSSKQNEYYMDLLEAWKEESPLTVEESVWKKIVFDRSYDLAQ